MTRIDLICGFLGAGKTTFIRRYADWLKGQGITFAVIENEFGAAGVDAAMLKEVADVAEISGGCICCGMKVNFHNQILELAKSYDRVVVEPSGIFNMDDYLDVLNSPQIKEACLPGCAVTIDDPASLGGMGSAELEVLYSQLISTGRIVISKTGLYPELTQKAVETLAALLGGDRDIRPLIETKPWEEFTTQDFQHLSQSPPQPIPHIRQTADHSTLFNSATLYPKERYSWEDARRICRELTSGECGAVFRVKGTIQSEQDEESFEINCTASEISIRPCMPQPSMLNIIGRNLDRKRIASVLEEAFIKIETAG